MSAPTATAPAPTASSTAFRGTLVASGFVIDVALIGETEARARVLELWRRTQLRLLALPTGSWLALLQTPQEVRSEHAPGLPVVTNAGGFAAPGLPTENGLITIPDDGATRSCAIAELRAVSTAGWLDLTSFDIVHLAPLDSSPPPPVTPDVELAPAIDLRTAAGVGPSRRSAAKFTGTGSRRRAGRRDDSGSRFRWAALALVVVAVAVVIVVVAALDDPANDDGNPWSFFILFPLLFLIPALRARAAERRSGAPGSAGGGRAPATRPQAAGRKPRRTGLLTRLFLRSPAGTALARRHARYLRSLTEQFERGQWDEALRAAIGLGQGSATLRLRLPKPRTSVAPRTTAGAASGGLYFGETVYEHLRELYRRAADQLEQDGRIEEAAFVLADLLNDPAAAVGLLERHDRLVQAAEIGEGRGLPDDQVVRLWWRAGWRNRAIEIARARGAFVAGIQRLAASDADAARELRAAWVGSCQQRGDHLAAVEAAWPEPELRHLVTADIESGIALGGPSAGRLFAHLATEHPTPETLRGALSILDDDSAEHRLARAEFVAAFATLTSGDLAHDRQLATGAARSLFRDAVYLSKGGVRDSRRAMALLSARADPLAAADLPSLNPGAASRGDARLLVSAPLEPGQLQAYDVAVTRGHALLVAHGQLGVRLLALDGRVRARWDVPAHELVMADHGGSALLVQHSGSTREIHRLDLATRKITRWTTLRITRLAPSFDGGLLTVVDDDGIAWLDVLGERPKVLRRELDNTARVLRTGRTPDTFSALVTVPSAVAGQAPITQLWAWEVATMALRVRRNLELPSDTRDAVLAAGQLVVLAGAHGEGAELTRYDGYADPVTRLDLDPGTTISASGEAYAVHTPQSDGGALIEIELPSAHVEVRMPTHAERGIRMHAGLLTVWDYDGRILAIDPSGGEVLASLRSAL